MEGIISNGPLSGGTVALRKIENGTWTLTAANTYTGATTLNAGTLRINAPGSLHASSAVTVNAATLGGDGIIGGTVTLNGNGNSILRGSDTDLTLESLTLKDAVSSQVGSAVRAKSLVATSVSFINNVSSDYGGAVYVAGSLEVTDSTFANNASPDGGAIYVEFDPGAVVNIVRTSFSGNRADYYGGALFVDADINISGSTFRGNSAG